MKKKLTKNDSISAVVKNFDVLVAEFEAFLKRENAHASYFREWEKAKEYSGTANVFYAWREWAKIINPLSWFTDAFIWDKSDNDYFYWQEKHKMWCDLYCRNLNK